MVASSIAGGFVLTALSGVHREDVTSVCIASSPHACLNFKHLRFLLASSILEEPKYEIKGLQYYLNGSKPQYKTFEYNSVDDVDY